MDITTIIETITKTINTLFNNLISSVDNNVYSILDDITFINKDIIYDNFTEKIFGINANYGIIIIANSLIVGFSIFYGIRYMFSIYGNSQVEKPYQFIFKLIIITICVNSSFFICEQILNINFLLSGAIRSVGENLLNTNINFEDLIIKINTIFSFNSTSLNVFSFDGMIKGYTSFSLFSLLFSYALRYILIKIFVLMAPLMIVTLLNSSTEWIFKSWIKSFISLLIMQSFISIILIIIFSSTYLENNVFSKLMYIGSIMALTKVNAYVSKIFGGISSEINTNVSSMKQLLK